MGDEIASRGAEEFLLVENGVGFGQRSPRHKTITNRVERFGESFVVLFDGDLLNEDEFRRSLAKEGYDLRDAGLADVLVCLLHAHGSTFPRHLSGPFALAIHRGDRIILARDGLGVRPLFYFQIGARLFFASQIKAIRRGAGAALELDRDSLYERCVFGDHLIGGATYFREVRQVPPGHVLTFSTRDPSRAPDDRGYGEAGKRFPEPRADGFKALIREIVEDNVRYYVNRGERVGVLLSGGFDSSVLAALAVRHAPAGARVRTFTISDDPEFPDVVAARRVARHLGTDHQEIIVRSADRRDLETGIYAYEDVIHRDTIFLLAKNMRGTVDSVLSGAGADIFGVPILERDRLESLSRRWAGVNGREEVSPGSLRLHGYMRWFTQGLEDDFWATVMAHFTNDYMPNQLFPSTERAFAHFGMEACFPYVHPDLKTMAMSLPRALHGDGERDKPVLRDAFADLDLPPDILCRPTLCSKRNLDSVKTGMRDMVEALPGKSDPGERRARLVRGDYLDFCLATLERQFCGAAPPRGVSASPAAARTRRGSPASGARRPNAAPGPT